MLKYLLYRKIENTKFRLFEESIQNSLFQKIVILYSKTLKQVAAVRRVVKYNCCVQNINKNMFMKNLVIILTFYGSMLIFSIFKYVKIVFKYIVFTLLNLKKKFNIFSVMYLNGYVS